MPESLSGKVGVDTEVLIAAKLKVQSGQYRITYQIMVL
ncbi:hypothetical protein RAMDARK_0664 [Rickettsia amblyommatis str. Darkwater]|nr:hypothetical protein RAMDARK_0664 [Rickettsia amblyommatis str. Darkwater]